LWRLTEPTAKYAEPKQQQERNCLNITKKNTAYETIRFHGVCCVEFLHSHPYEKNLILLTTYPTRRILIGALPRK